MAYTSTLLIAAGNPMTMLPYLGVTSALEAGKPLIVDRELAMPIGVILGNASWYLVLARSTNAMFRSARLAQQLVGGLLMILGAALCARIV